MISDGILNVDCFQNVFSFLSLKEINTLAQLNKSLYSIDNEFWKYTCPHLLDPRPKIDFNLPGSVRNFFVQKDFDEEIIRTLRLFLKTVAHGSIEFSFKDKPVLTFEINSPAHNNHEKLSKKIHVKHKFVKRLNVQPVNQEFKKYPTGRDNPFFVLTNEQFDKIRELSAPFKVFLENHHKKVGCECKKGDNCAEFIEIAKKEMRSYFKETASEESFSLILKKIEQVTLDTFNSQDQINIIAETFPCDLKIAIDTFIIFNKQTKAGKTFKLICTPK